MKNVLTKVSATVFVFLLSAIVTLGYGDEWIEKTVVDKEFKINSNATLIIDHEFGSVVCENWEKDVISVTATVRVKTSNESKAQTIIDNVIIDVKGNSNKVEAICELNQRNQKKSSTNVSIDFDIKMPASVSLVLDHSFGSASIETVSGPASISSEYGYLKVVSLDNAQNEVEIEFGKGDIKFIAGGEVEIGYSNVSIEGSEDLSFEAEYSDVSIDKVKRLSFEIEGGNAEIGYVENLELEASMTNIDIKELSGSIDCETDYGSMNIDYVSKNFSIISIANSFGSVNINIDKDATYQLEAEGVYCQVKYSEDNADIKYRNSTPGSTIVKGVIGSSKTPNSSVIVSSEYGSVNLGTK